VSGRRHSRPSEPAKAEGIEHHVSDATLTAFAQFPKSRE
jgi:hypothetical protein